MNNEAKTLTETLEAIGRVRQALSDAAFELQNLEWKVKRLRRNYKKPCPTKR